VTLITGGDIYSVPLPLNDKAATVTAASNGHRTGEGDDKKTNHPAASWSMSVHMSTGTDSAPAQQQHSRSSMLPAGIAGALLLPERWSASRLATAPNCTRALARFRTPLRMPLRKRHPRKCCRSKDAPQKTKQRRTRAEASARGGGGERERALEWRREKGGHPPFPPPLTSPPPLPSLSLRCSLYFTGTKVQILTHKALRVGYQGDFCSQAYRKHAVARCSLALLVQA
jgi:hypothetical protein